VLMRTPHAVTVALRASRRARRQFFVMRGAESRRLVTACR
jgi:hypothetical protein